MDSGGGAQKGGGGHRKVAFLDLPPQTSELHGDSLSNLDTSSVVSGRTVLSYADSTASAASFASVDSQATAKISNVRGGKARGGGNSRNANDRYLHPAASQPAGYEISSKNTTNSNIERARKGRSRAKDRDRERAGERPDKGDVNARIRQTQASAQAHARAWDIKSKSTTKSKAGAWKSTSSASSEATERISNTSTSATAASTSSVSDPSAPQAKLVAEVMAEIEMELDAEESDQHSGVESQQWQETRERQQEYKQKQTVAGLKSKATAAPPPLRRKSSASASSHHSGDKDRNRERTRISADIITGSVCGPVSTPSAPKKDIEAADALFQMGKMELSAENFEASRRCLEQSLVMNQSNLGMDHPTVGDNQHYLGLVQLEFGKYETACMTLWEAQRVRKLNMDLVGAAESLQEIGKVHRQGGRTELALDCYGECLRVRRAELGDDNLKVADAYIDLGNVESDIGRIRDACNHFKNALTIMKLNSMNEAEDSCTTADINEKICHLLQKMSKWELGLGDYDHALAHLQEFVETRRLHNQTQDIIYVEALINISKISMEHGDDTTAYKSSIEALEVFEANKLEHHNAENARFGREARTIAREFVGNDGNNSIFQRLSFGVGFESLRDEVG